MALIQTQFSLTYELVDGLIRIQKAGEFKNERGETISYPCSVKVIARNIQEGDIDPETNFASINEVETTFKFICSDLNQAGNLARAFNQKFAKKEPFYFKGSGATRKQDGTFEVTVRDLPIFDEKKAAK